MPGNSNPFYHVDQPSCKNLGNKGPAAGLPSPTCVADNLPRCMCGKAKLIFLMATFFPGCTVHTTLQVSGTSFQCGGLYQHGASYHRYLQLLQEDMTQVRRLQINPTPFDIFLCKPAKNQLYYKIFSLATCLLQKAVKR